MPSSIIHRCVSKRVLEKGNLYNQKEAIFLYDVGSIAPDSWRNTNRFKNSQLPKKDKRKYSHFSLNGEYLEHSEIFYNQYKKELDSPFMLGYFVHLLTDFHWRETMFYRCFDKNGSIKLLDGSLINERNTIKELLEKENTKIAFLLSKHFKLNELRHLSIEELSNLPQMKEIEFDGLNDTITYTNKAGTLESKHSLVVYKVEDFIEGIEECSDYIIDKLIEYDIIKR